MPLWGTTISFGVTINHTYLDDVAKNGQYLGSYNGTTKAYSTRFSGNKQMPNTMVAAQKAKFAKTLKLLTKLQRIFTVAGIVDGAEKIIELRNVYISTGELDMEKTYNLISTTIGVAGWQGAVMSISMDLQQLSTSNALEYYQETEDWDFFIKTIQPGPKLY